MKKINLLPVLAIVTACLTFASQSSISGAELPAGFERLLRQASMNTAPVQANLTGGPRLFLPVSKEGDCTNVGVMRVNKARDIENYRICADRIEALPNPPLFPYRQGKRALAEVERTALQSGDKLSAYQGYQLLAKRLVKMAGGRNQCYLIRTVISYHHRLAGRTLDVVCGRKH